MSKIWMNDFGLRFPSGQTYRIGLSTIIEASEMTLTPTEAFDMMEDFVAEFRMIRTQNEGRVTFKRFPSDPETFTESHPERL